MEAKVYIIHENDAWTKPLIDALNCKGIPNHNWFINSGKINLEKLPPDGVFYNRMSASAHTRNHRYAVELTETILSWLDLHGKRVFNNRKAINLEVRKAEQMLALKAFRIAHPPTIVVNNKTDLVLAAEELNVFPFMVKPNRGGKGKGVKKYNDISQLKHDVENELVEESLDGIYLVQQYIKPANGHITRVEMIGGKLAYAVKVDAQGGFELCPADSCNIEDAFCPADQKEATKFQIIENYVNPDIEKYQALLKSQGVDIGALEYVTGADGNRYVYDINTNTNYNSAAEQVYSQNIGGMDSIADLLGNELYKRYPELKGKVVA